MATYRAVRLYGKGGEICVPQDCWPVGSIYISVKNVNPTKYFGGTWVAWGSGRVPVGINTNDPAFNTVEKTGGEKTHKLSISEMPSHRHYKMYVDVTQCGMAWVDHTGSGTALRALNPQDAGGKYDGINTGPEGNDQAHNNLQPYIVCYMWKRTA